MDEKGMAALDLRFITRELQQLVGARVRKIHQYGKKQFLIEFHLSGAGAQWLYCDNSKVFLADHKPPSPPAPPSFCMFLRKHLMGKSVKSVRQYLFNRIIEITFQESVLVLEFIPPGNMILCDSDYVIIMPREVQKWRDRIIKPKIAYKHPKLQEDPFQLDVGDLQRKLSLSKENLGHFVAVDLGLGGLYGRELLSRAGLEESTPTEELRLEATSRLHAALESIDKLTSSLS